jgi:radical SAM protein with 4Fe4S-binding SPASM domain
MSFYNFNKILSHGNIHQLNENGFRKLIHVRIEPTELCNYSCKFCVTQDPERIKLIQKEGYDGQDRKFDLNRLSDLLDELKEVGVKAISFVAVGDPLMFPNISKVLKKAIKLKFDLGLTSNFGMPLKDEVIESLTEFKWLRWSMNGGSEDVYLKTNNPKGKNPAAAYKNAKENIKRIIYKKKKENKKVLVNASYVVSEWNHHDVVNAAKLGRELEIDNLFFRPDMKPMENRKDMPLDIITKNKSLLDQAIEFQNDNFKINIEQERENDVLKVQDENLVCFYSNHSIYIAANGDVYPCCYTRINPKFVIGNIANQKFDEFWKNKNNSEKYKEITLNTCPSCPYNEINKSLEKLYTTGESPNTKPLEIIDNFV